MLHGCPEWSGQDVADQSSIRCGPCECSFCGVLAEQPASGTNHTGMTKHHSLLHIGFLVYMISRGRSSRHTTRCLSSMIRKALGTRLMTGMFAKLTTSSKGAASSRRSKTSYTLSGMYRELYPIIHYLICSVNLPRRRRLCCSLSASPEDSTPLGVDVSEQKVLTRYGDQRSFFSFFFYFTCYVWLALA